MFQPKLHSKMVSFKFVVFTVLMITFMAHLTDSLMCYQCGTTSDMDDCINDYSGLVNTSKGESIRYSKNCTDSHPDWDQRYCMIETAETNGKITLYHRGCHDGKTFSSFDHVRFQNLTPNNYTTCAQINLINKFVCYRFCDTDFCNGPKVPPVKIDPCKEYLKYPWNTTLPEGVACDAVMNGPIAAVLLSLVTVSLFLIGCG